MTNEATLVIHEDDIKVLENLMSVMPDHITTLQEAVATKLVADELRLPFMTSVGDLMVINGTVGMTSKLMLALVYKAGHRLDIDKMTATEASVTAHRWMHDEWVESGTFVFKMSDAKAANLDVKDTYKAYPADMLMNKAIARAVRFAFPDVLRGYVPDEMEEIAGLEFGHDIHLDPTEEALEVEEVAEILDAEVVE